MRYAFFGTTEFSLRILNVLLASPHPPALVVCNPDRPVGRKRVLTSPAVKLRAAEAGIPVLQPEKLDEEFAADFAALNLEFSVLASYGKILPASLLSASGRGVVGVHVSLLPKYRGASPMQTVILQGEKVTGVTLYLMDEKVDHGPILAKAEIALEHRNFLELQAESALVAGNLLLSILPDLAAGRIVPEKQDESEATFTRKFASEDGFVDPDLLRMAESGDPAAVQKVDRMIRALNPEPGVWTMREGKRLKLLKAEVKDGALKLKIVQREGKTPENA